MLPKILILFLLVCSFANADSFSYGMSVEDVQVEHGRADSTMKIGPKEILIYEGGARLEFIDGKLVKENDQLLTPQNDQKKLTEEAAQPFIKAEEIVREREKKTIGASLEAELIDYSKLGEDYGSSKLLESLEADLNAEQLNKSSNSSDSPKERLREILIAFGIEMLVTLAVLSIAFQISGFPSIFRQILLLSLAVAVVGALLDTLLRVGPLNPIRSGAGFIVLLVLIRQTTDVREWATAIRIALTARIVSILFIWIAMIGVAALFTL